MPNMDDADLSTAEADAYPAPDAKVDANWPSDTDICIDEYDFIIKETAVTRNGKAIRLQVTNLRLNGIIHAKNRIAKHTGILLWNQYELIIANIPIKKDNI